VTELEATDLEATDLEATETVPAVATLLSVTTTLSTVPSRRYPLMAHR